MGRLRSHDVLTAVLPSGLGLRDAAALTLVGRADRLAGGSDQASRDRRWCSRRITAWNGELWIWVVLAIGAAAGTTAPLSYAAARTLVPRLSARRR